MRKFLLMGLIFFQLVPLPVFCSANQTIQKFEAAGKKASVLMMEIHTGKKLYQYRPSWLSRSFAAGSLIKPFTLLALSQSDKSISHEPFFCRGFQDYDEKKICWLKPGHGSLTLTQALAFSCNEYFFQRVAPRVRLNVFLKLLKQFGFSGFSVRGLVREPLLRAFIGLDGIFRATPEKILNAYAALFNGGMVFSPQGSVVNQVWIEPEFLETLREGLRGAYLYGTLSKAKKNLGNSDLLGKTGTGAFLVNGFSSWRKTTGWAVILWPSQQPRYGMVIVVEPGTGSEDAAVLAGEILNFWRREGKMTFD